MIKNIFFNFLTTETPVVDTPVEMSLNKSFIKENKVKKSTQSVDSKFPHEIFPKCFVHI